jgi:hypothetical protein
MTEDLRMVIWDRQSIRCLMDDGSLTDVWVNPNGKVTVLNWCAPLEWARQEDGEHSPRFDLYMDVTEGTVTQSSSVIEVMMPDGRPSGMDLQITNTPKVPCPWSPCGSVDCAEFGPGKGCRDPGDEPE